MPILQIQPSSQLYRHRQWCETPPTIEQNPLAEKKYITLSASEVTIVG
jgi:hypothetical protein